MKSRGLSIHVALFATFFVFWLVIGTLVMTPKTSGILSQPLEFFKIALLAVALVWGISLLVSADSVPLRRLLLVGGYCGLTMFVATSVLGILLLLLPEVSGYELIHYPRYPGAFDPVIVFAFLLFLSMLAAAIGSIPLLVALAGFNRKEGEGGRN